MNKKIGKQDVIERLIRIARAAHNLADCTCEEDGIFTIDVDSLNELSTALDTLSELPEPEERVFGTGPAKAEAFLNKKWINVKDRLPIKTGRYSVKVIQGSVNKRECEMFVFGIMHNSGFRFTPLDWTTVTHWEEI